MAIRKIRSHAAFKVDGLADIKHIPPLVFHKIDAGLLRKTRYIYFF
jgi:hypothetical protein